MGKKYFAEILPIILLGTLIAIGLSVVWATDIHAQEEGPVCPPGFVFDRLSGIGCVQEDCFSVGYYDYTGHCICAEGFTGCSEPVDYSSFDRALCDPFCPDFMLLACIQGPEVCPETGVMVSEEGGGTSSESSGETGEEPLVPNASGNILENIRHWVTGEKAQAPSPASAATAAIAGTILLGTWLAVDWFSENDLSLLTDNVSGMVSEVSDAIKKFFKREAAKSAGATLAEKSTDIIDSLNSGKSFDNALESALGGKPAPAHKPFDQPDAQAGRSPDQPAADAKPKSPAPPDSKDIPLAKDSKPVTTKIQDHRSRVFEGEEAMVILKELEKLSQNISKNDKLNVTRAGLDHFIGTHPDGQPRKITLPSGREIIVTQVEAIGFEGEENVPDGSGPRQIDFSKPLVVTAELVDEAVDQASSGPPPASPPSSVPPTSGTAPAGQAPSGTQPPKVQQLQQAQPGTPPPDSGSSDVPGMPDAPEDVPTVKPGEPAPSGHKTGERMEPGDEVINDFDNIMPERDGPDKSVPPGENVPDLSDQIDSEKKPIGYDDLPNAEEEK